MTSKLVVGIGIDNGLIKNREPFVIDNDAFPVLINAYQWRGKIKRKRGTSNLSRLTRYIDTSSSSYSSISTIMLDGTGSGNILTGFSLQSTSSITPGTVTIVAPGPTNYTDTAKDGTLSPSGTINYASGVIMISAQAGQNVSVKISYYPGLPVLGLPDLNSPIAEFPANLEFDTTYAYNLQQEFPNNSYSVSFYKNPPTSDYPSPYAQKTVVTPTTWNGQDYQQYWGINYQGAFWVTNGIQIPFIGNASKIGMQFAPTNTITYVSNTATSITLTITSSPLVLGDFVFFNEWTGTNANSLNFQSGYVTTVGANIVITLPSANLGAGPYTPGIVQYLTNRSNSGVDCIRWYDGDPTAGDPPNPTLTGNHGWVNFTPPLSQSIYDLNDLPPAQYYLVGARMIQPFKDRLVFLGPVVQTSSGSPIYLSDVVIYSQNGTPYYTSSWTSSLNDPRVIDVANTPILVPVNQTGFPAGYFEDSTGFGGIQEVGIDEDITSSSTNEDVLILGMNTNQVRMVSTGSDITPFAFYLINSELGTSSTFSTINMDKGVLSRGSRGYIMANQNSGVRIDVLTPDEVFEIRLTDNGPERITAERDYINEWVYFTYPGNQSSSSKYRFPTRTLQYNYRDNSWAIFDESYTTYGTFRRKTGFTWATVGTVYATWSVWNDPWNAGTSTLEQPDVIAGNQQGFVLVRADGTGEGSSLFIQSFSGSTVNCPNHCLNNGDYIRITGCLGTIRNEVNNKTFSVGPPITQNSFVLNPTIGSGTYLGGGLITRMYVPFIQTKQFPTAWGDARKTRLGVQRYLLNKTDNAQITLLIYLNQDATNPYNTGGIVPGKSVLNDSLIYSTILYTCPESVNLGLTPANTNLMTPTASTQKQIWHRMNTSLIGDTVQLGFTMSDAQMRAVDETGFPVNAFEEIELNGFIIDVSPSQMLV